MSTYRIPPEIIKYFPKLTAQQKEQLGLLEELCKSWNQRINIISKKDIDNLYIHHILHSLSIGSVIKFPKGSYVLDLGTGGGFPGIPLAILFPEVQFTLVDSIKKKIKVVESITSALKIKNVKSLAIRAEELKKSYDFVVTRGVGKLDMLYKWSKRVIKKNGGLICLKGGDIKNELATVPLRHKFYTIKNFIDEPYFLNKYILYFYF